MYFNTCSSQIFRLQDILGPYTFVVFIVLLIPPIIILQKFLPETKRNSYVENANLFLSREDAKEQAEPGFRESFRKIEV